MSKKLFKFSDLIKAIDVDTKWQEPDYTEQKEATDTRQNIKSFYINICKASYFDESIFKLNDDYYIITSNLIKRMVARWLTNDNIFIYCGEDPSLALVYGIFRRILSSIRSTAPKYVPLIKFQSSKLNEVAEKITQTNSSVQKHNSTPNSENDYSADTYTDDVVKVDNTSTNNYDLINQYENYNNTVEDLYTKWLKEILIGKEIYAQKIEIGDTEEWN